MGVTSPNVHSTRLKDRILINFPELQDGRDVLLVPNEEIGTNLRQACENDVENDTAFMKFGFVVLQCGFYPTTIIQPCVLGKHPALLNSPRSSAKVIYPDPASCFLESAGQISFSFVSS